MDQISCIKIGLIVNDEIVERFVQFSKMCNDENILQKFERKRNQELYFRLTFSSLENCILFFTTLGRVIEIHIGGNINIFQWQKN